MPEVKTHFVLGGGVVQRGVRGRVEQSASKVQGKIGGLRRKMMRKERIMWSIDDFIF